MRPEEIYPEEFVDSDNEQISEEDFMDVAPKKGEIDPEFEPEIQEEIKRDSRNRFIDRPNSAGAKLGERQKLSASTKDELLKIIRDEIPYLKESLVQLRTEDPKGHAQILATLAKFVSPTLQSVQAELEGRTNLTIEHRLIGMMNPTVMLPAEEDDD